MKKTCDHGQSDGQATRGEIAQIGDGGYCPLCQRVLRNGWWYVDDPVELKRREAELQELDDEQTALSSAIADAEYA